MSTPSKPTPAPTPAPRPAASSKASAKPEQTFLFDKENYMWMIGGIVLILIGFFMMSGGKSPNPNEFHYDEIYSFRRITLAPIIVMLGFGIEAYAIMKKPKETSGTQE